MIIFLCLLMIALISGILLAQRNLSQQPQEEYLPIPVRVDEIDILARRRKRR